MFFLLEAKAESQRISFVAPESANSARVLAELLADIVRDAGGAPRIETMCVTCILGFGMRFSLM